jgi:hypothetical protein
MIKIFDYEIPSGITQGEIQALTELAPSLDRKPTIDGDRWWEILQVSESAEPEEIEEAYKRALSSTQGKAKDKIHEAFRVATNVDQPHSLNVMLTIVANAIRWRLRKPEVTAEYLSCMPAEDLEYISEVAAKLMSEGVEKISKQQAQAGLTKKVLEQSKKAKQ